MVDELLGAFSGSVAGRTTISFICTLGRTLQRLMLSPSLPLLHSLTPPPQQ